jgi:hypothetical protein
MSTDKARVRHQSFVDPEEQRPYIERLQSHLDSVAEPVTR